VAGTRGFLLVEVIVATLVLTAGVLALEGTALAVERMIASGQRMGGAAAAAASRLDLLAAGGCAALADGAAADERYAQRWVVSAAGPLRLVRLTISYADGSGTHTDLVESARWCP
jgi:Tfp pilus assembly protein PilV